MAFIQSCFIRKNTLELRKKLEELGYTNTPNGIGEWFIPIEELKYLVTYPVSGCYQGCNGYWYEDDFDCGENEELFLALAALRDDTPINSYYWFNDNLFKCEGLEIDRVLKNNTANYLLKCRRVDNSMIISCFKERNVRKATVEEIVEHFK